MIQVKLPSTSPNKKFLGKFRSVHDEQFLVVYVQSFFWSYAAGILSANLFSLVQVPFLVGYQWLCVFECIEFCQVH